MSQIQTTGAGVAKTLKRGIVSLAASGVVVAAVGSGTTAKKIKVYAYSFQSRNDGMTIQITDGSGGTNLDHVWTLNAREGVVDGPTVPTTYLYATTAGNALFASISGAGTVDVAVSYWDDDAV